MGGELVFVTQEVGVKQVFDIIFSQRNAVFVRKNDDLLMQLLLRYQAPLRIAQESPSIKIVAKRLVKHPLLFATPQVAGAGGHMFDDAAAGGGTNRQQGAETPRFHPQP